MENLASSLYYIGSFNTLHDITKHYKTLQRGVKIGDVALVGDITYVYIGDQWEDVGTYDNNIKINYPTKCKFCGGSMHSYRCEYCGTEYPEYE